MSSRSPSPQIFILLGPPRPQVRECLASLHSAGVESVQRASFDSHKQALYGGLVFAKNHLPCLVLEDDHLCNPDMLDRLAEVVVPPGFHGITLCSGDHEGHGLGAVLWVRFPKSMPKLKLAPPVTGCYCRSVHNWARLATGPELFTHIPGESARIAERQAMSLSHMRSSSLVSASAISAASISSGS